MNVKKLSILLYVLILLAACSAPGGEETLAPSQPTETQAPVQQEPELTEAPREFPGRILLIGDSFTAGIDDPLIGLVTTAHPDENIEIESVWVGGTSLEGHWLFTDAQKTINEGSWTTVVLQDDLLIGAIDNESFFEYARLFHNEVANIGAETILYMTWEYDVDDGRTIEDIANAYRTIGDELGVKVAPVGLAWANALSERPDFNIYSDGVHSNLRGAYLTVCVLYATIFEANPEGVQFPPQALLLELEEFESMTDEDIAFLQRVAWETVQEY
jgi:hypothetical protein